jgi:predicted DNA binding protein
MYRIMWQLKVVISAENTPIGSLALKHKIVVQAYPLLSNNSSDCLISFSGVVSGPKDNVSSFLKELEEMPQVKNIEIRDNHFIGRYQDKPGYEEFYNREIFYVEPWTINGITNEHRLHLGSWQKEHLTALYNKLRQHHKGSILNITEDKSPNLFLFSIFPQITQKQREAIELAVQHGYYEYPRRVEVKELAQIAKCSFSTFHAHLRKAEKSLIPQMTKSLLNDTYR